MKKLALAFLTALSVLSQANAHNLDHSHYAEFWAVNEVLQSEDFHLLVMENLSVWKVEPGQIEHIQEIVDYSEEE